MTGHEEWMIDIGNLSLPLTVLAGMLLSGQRQGIQGLS